MFDVENSETELLIAQNSGDPFIYDIELKKITQIFPIIEQGYSSSSSWAVFVNLLDFNLLITTGLMIFNRD